MAPLLEIRNVTKRFPGVLANDHISLTVEAGEIHALLGENGAGKSTLMQVLYGLYHRDEGEILINGQPAAMLSPSESIALGVGMIHQEFMLIPRFTVVENVVLGLETGTSVLLDLNAAASQLKALSEKHGLEVDPWAQVESLSVGVQQRVEILKLLYRQAKILILDEPTAVLTPQETENLFKVLRSLADQGHAVIFITHKLHEVMAIADRVTVLRDGKVIGSVSTQDTTAKALARMMVGREINFKLQKQPYQCGKVMLEIDDLHVRDESEHERLRGVNLQVCMGEILGLAGVDGNGQSELAEALMSLRRIQKGRVLVNGKDVTHLSTAALREQGVAYVPADRRNVGSVATLSIAQNAILGAVQNYARAAKTFIYEAKVKANAQALVERFDVRTPSISMEARKLSGGNLQKIVLGREVMRQPSLLLVEQPTRGLDVGATEYVQSQLLAERDKGTAILLISTELEEILTLSDRIAVIYKGEIMGILDNQDGVDIEIIGLMMAGTRAEDLDGKAEHA